MLAQVIWIDSKEAKIFKLSPEGVQTHPVHTHGPKHHDHHIEQEKLFKDTAQALKGAQEVLIVGPGEAKTHFKSYLVKHHAGDLGKNIVGVEAMDHPTEKQIVAEGRKFFKKFDLFHE